jgi:hypothetical protein
MDEAGGIRLPAVEEVPSPPASAPSPEAVLIAASGGGSGCARGGASEGRSSRWADAATAVLIAASGGGSGCARGGASEGRSSRWADAIRFEARSVGLCGAWADRDERLDIRPYLCVILAM